MAVNKALMPWQLTNSFYNGTVKLIYNDTSKLIYNDTAILIYNDTSKLIYNDTTRLIYNDTSTLIYNDIQQSLSEWHLKKNNYKRHSTKPIYNDILHSLITMMLYQNLLTMIHNTAHLQWYIMQPIDNDV